MSFLAKSPTLPQGAAGADPKHSSSYKAADAVPLGWGRDVYASKWISDKYDAHTQSAGSSKPAWQYCSIAAAYCAGPVDFVGKVFADGKVLADLAYDFADGEQAHEFVLNPALASGRAFKLVLHRGTEDAPSTAADALSAATGQTHPPYRGLVWAEWINLDLGQGSAAVPSLALELGRHAPTVGDYTGSDSHPYGVNPFAAIYALCRVASGGDFDAGLLDADHWGDQALALEAQGVGGREGNFVHCHPSFKAATSLGDALSQILAYVDGYVFAREGKLCVGWFPAAAVDASGLDEITEADLEAKPSGGGIPDWNQGPTSVAVIYRSFFKDYDEDVARYNAPANRENNLSAEPARKERPFIHDPEQAALIAADSAADSATGEIETNLTVFKSRAAALMPGDLVSWDYGPHSLDLVCRVTARRIRFGSASDVLTLTRERGAYPRPYVAPVDERVLPVVEEPGELADADVRLYLLPRGFGLARQVVALINRPVRSDIGALLSLSVNGSAPWSQILDQRSFAAKCAVGGSGVDAVATTVRLVSTSLDFARMAAQDAVAQADDTLLLLIGDELLSVAAITSVATNTVDVTVLRGRRETTAAVHAASAEAWLFYRGELTAATHLEFSHVRDGSNVYDAGIATKYFKLALFTSEDTGAAKPDDPGLALTLPDLSEEELVAAYTILLSSEAHTVACDSAGTVLSGQLGASSTAKTTVAVVRGSTVLTAVASSPGADQFAIALGTPVNATATKETDTRVRADTLTADTGTVEIVVNVEGLFTFSKIFTLTKAKNGATGFTGATGAPGDSLIVEYSVDGSTSWHSTFTTGDLYRREKIGVGGTWSSAIKIVGVDGTNGTRGSRQFYAATTGTTWSNTEADAAITSMGVTKVPLDTVTLYKTSAGYSETRYWDGTAWLVVTQVIDGALIVHGTIGSDQIVAGISLTSPLILGGVMKLNHSAGAALVCSTTADFSDIALVRINGGGGDGATRGGQLDVFGNEYTTYGGSVFLTPGAVSTGMVRIRDYLGNDRLIASHTGVDLKGPIRVNSPTDRSGSTAALQIVNDNTTLSRVAMVTYHTTASSNFEGYVAGGTEASPSAIGTGRNMQVQFKGYDGSGFQNGTSMRMYATENWSGSARGSMIDFKVTPNGSTIQLTALELQPTGDCATGRDLILGRNIAGDCPVTGDVYSTGAGASRVGFLNAAGASSPQTFVGLRYDAGNSRAELAALSGGVAWRDVLIAPNAHIMFGTHTSLGSETITGYITIKDAAGNLRKLAVLS